MEVGRSSQEAEGTMETLLLLVMQTFSWLPGWRQGARSEGYVWRGGLGAARHSLDTDLCPWIVKSCRFCWLLKYCARKEVRARGGGVLGTNVHFSNLRRRNCAVYFGVLLSCCFLQ